MVRRRDYGAVVTIQTQSSSNIGGQWLNFEITEHEIAEMVRHKDDLFTAYSDIRTSIDAEKRVSAEPVTNTSIVTLLHFFRYTIFDKAGKTLYRDPFGYFDMSDAQINGDREKASLSTDTTNTVVILEECITTPSRLEIMRYVVSTIADSLIRQTRDEQLQTPDRETVLRDDHDIASETFKRLNSLQQRLQAIAASVERKINDVLIRQNNSPQVKVNGSEDMIDVTDNIKSLYLSGMKPY